MHYLVDAGDVQSIVAHSSNDARHKRPMPVLIQYIPAWRIDIEVCAIDVVHNACARLECKLVLAPALAQHWPSAWHWYLRLSEGQLCALNCHQELVHKRHTCERICRKAVYSRAEQ